MSDAAADESPEQVQPGVQGLVLVIEDEPGIVDFLVHGLAGYGFAVESALDGERGATRALTESFDLVVLDLMLPGRSGHEVLAAIRAAKPTLPVIVLTARGELEERIAGLDAGAVDYLVKPFELGELAARIRAQVRTATTAPMMVLRSGDIEMNLLTREVRRADELIRLSTTEFELLAFLVQHRGQVVSREQIQRAVWTYEHDPGTNNVDVYIGYLRRKLRRPESEAPIVTIRSVGYRLDDVAS
jgi:DNA-binding response OmpR family regulator